MSTGTRAGETSQLSEATAQEFAGRLRGRLVLPADPAYNQVRAVWNGMIDKRPGMIVQCAGNADVIEAVRFARQHGLLVAVRGGGHNVSGNAVCDGGLVIDLSQMTGIRVDPGSRTVRVEGGATIGDLDRETQMFGLAVPMGLVSETGIAGLTLGGGLGWLRRKYGLSCDNLISVDLVTAAGELVTASAEQHPELLWAVSGGGGNFGVVTSFEFRAYQVGPEVYFAHVSHPGDRAREALRGFREWAREAPDEVSALAVLWRLPELPEIPSVHHGTPGLSLLAMHCGEPAEGESVLRRLRDIGSPVADLSATTAYLDVQRTFDEDYPAHVMRYYWKSRHLGELPDEAIDVLVARNEESPSPHANVDIWQLGGAMARRGPADSALGDRSAPYLVGIEANWQDASDDQATVAWGRRIYQQLAPFASGSGYLNFPGLYEEHDQLVRDAFGGNLARLRELKRRYDPDNLFQLNHNISPS